MSDARRLVLPVVDGQLSKPDWLRSDGGQEVQPLMERLQPEAEQEPKRERERVRERERPPVSAAAPEPDDPGRRSRREMRPEPTTSELERPPPPPRVPRMSSIAAFAPGGRSVVPPAADGGEARGTHAFAEAVTELAIARSGVLSTIEGDLLDLALHIASAVIETEVQRNPELHLTLVRAALRALGESTHARLRVSHEAFAALAEHKGGETFEVNGIAVELVADSTIPGLGCVIDEEHVRVDATVAERLRSVRIAFEDERRRKPGGVE